MANLERRRLPRRPPILRRRDRHPPPRAAPIDGALHAVHAAQRAARHPARGSHGAARHRERLVPRRVGAREAGRTGFAHLFEHLMFMGSGHVKDGRVRHAARSRRRHQQRLDRRRIGRTTTSTCRRTRSTSRCSSNRTAWAICSTRCRPRRVDAPARRRQERAPAELRERALRDGVDRDRQDALSRRGIRTAGRRSATWKI